MRKALSRQQVTQSPAAVQRRVRKTAATAGFQSVNTYSEQQATRNSSVSLSLNSGSAAIAQRKQVESLQQSSQSVAQLEKARSIQLKSTKQILQEKADISQRVEEEELMQGKFDTAQLMEKEDLLQGKFDTAQLVEEEDLLQGKFDTAQLVEEDLLQGKFDTAQLMEEEDLLQGKFDTAQLMEEEDLLQGKFDTAQLVEEEDSLQGKFEPTQLKEGAKKNDTGLPNNLKAGIEHLSGASLDGVKVHYNSAKPGQLQAHAYAQGKNIHLASGQEKHLPHEAWHVVQQAQGRVKPTMSKGGAQINDDQSLETEADVQGAKAMQFKPEKRQQKFLS